MHFVGHVARVLASLRGCKYTGAFQHAGALRKAKGYTRLLLSNLNYCKFTQWVCIYVVTNRVSPNIVTKIRVLNSNPLYRDHEGQDKA